jgi:hypothetical protein
MNSAAEAELDGAAKRRRVIGERPCVPQRRATGQIDADDSASRPRRCDERVSSRQAVAIEHAQNHSRSSRDAFEHCVDRARDVTV